MVTSIGKVRPVSCKYAGEFLGGTGYSCIVRNMDNDLRRVNMECAGYDRAGRLIGNIDRNLQLNGETFGPGEERVVRYYFPPEASAALCADLEGYASMRTEIYREQAKLMQNDMWSELRLK